MGREVRKVPADWQHPTDEHGNYIPLSPGPWEKRHAQWMQGKTWWDAGFRWHWGEEAFVLKEATDTDPWEEWDGAEPQQADYMPTWAPATATHYQMYEDTTEGTPLSPPMPTPEDLARWLVDHKASAFGGQTASYEGWLAVCKGRWAPGLVLTRYADGTGTMLSGVEAAAHD